MISIQYFMKYKVIYISLIALAVVSAWLYVIMRGELVTKGYYAALQRIEIERRPDRTTVAPELIVNLYGLGYNVLGLPTRDKIYPRIWVILDEVAPNGSVLLIPVGIAFYSDCEAIRQKIGGSKVDERVNEFLMANCRK